MEKEKFLQPPLESAVGRSSPSFIRITPIVWKAAFSTIYFIWELLRRSFEGWKSTIWLTERSLCCVTHDWQPHDADLCQPDITTCNRCCLNGLRLLLPASLTYRLVQPCTLHLLDECVCVCVCVYGSGPGLAADSGVKQLTCCQGNLSAAAHSVTLTSINEPFSLILTYFFKAFFFFFYLWLFWIQTTSVGSI